MIIRLVYDDNPSPKLNQSAVIEEKLPLYSKNATILMCYAELDAVH